MKESIVSIIDKLIVMRDQPVLLDRDVAAIYGVETKRINEAIKNNPEKFPDGYILHPNTEELALLRSNFSTSKPGRGGTRYTPTIFTEKGLYMLATILKSPMAVEATFEIIETFAQVRELKSSLIALHNEQDPEKQRGKMTRFSQILSSVVMPELRPEETETTLELNFFIGKLKHTVKRKRRENGPDIVEEPETTYGKEDEE